MARYFLSPIYLDTSNPYFPDGIWKHALQDHPDTPYSGGEIKVDPKTGQPTEKALLVLVDDHQKLVDSKVLIPLPDVLKGAPTRNVDGKEKIKAAAVKAEIDVSVIDYAATWDDVLIHLGRKNNPDFAIK